jgi:hypothetical protein
LRDTAPPDPRKPYANWQGTPPPYWARTGHEVLDNIVDQQAKEIEYWRQACSLRDEDLREARAEIKRLHQSITYYQRRHLPPPKPKNIDSAKRTGP